MGRTRSGYGISLKGMPALSKAMANPVSALLELDRIDAEESLIGFVRRAWEVLEPGQPFVDGWAVRTVAEHLEAVTRGEIRFLLINIPPGCTKSMLTNVFWPAWEWGPRKKPWHRFISASYEKSLATRDLVRCRDLMRSEWFQSLWPLDFKMDQDQKTYYENERRGWRMASSVGSSLTGHRGDRIIIDDPHSVRTAESDAERTESRRWFSETVPTRLNKQDESAIVVIKQRLHALDISGMVLDEKGRDWVHLCLPMEFEKRHRSWSVVPRAGVDPAYMRRVVDDGDPLPRYVPDADGRLMWPQDQREEDDELLWPERFSRPGVEDLKSALRQDGGDYAVAAQLQQRPVPRGGGMFRRDDFVVVDQRDCPDVARWVRGWDLAASTGTSAAYTVGVKIGMTRDKRIVIGDVVRLRGTPHEVERTIRACAEHDGHAVPISIPQDPGQAGKAQRAYLAGALHGYNVHFSPESGSKEIRAEPLASQAECGNIILIRAPWNDAFLGEAVLFPRGRFLDQIDAASRGYAYLVSKTSRGAAASPGKVIT